MAGTVNLPAVGKVKSIWVWGGAAVVAVIVGVAYMRHKNSAASAATTAAADTSTIDPQTGYPAGSAGDQAALAQLQGTGGAYYGAGGGYAGYGTGYGAQQYYYDPQDGLYDLTAPYTGSSGGGTSNTGPGTFTDNAYWVQYAVENVTGYSAGQVQGALAAYLAGMGLTTTQMSIYQAAIAVAGNPPVPPKTQAHLQNGTGNPHPFPPVLPVTVPDVVSEDLVNAQRALGEEGLKSTVSGPRTTKAGEVREVTAQSPAAGTKVSHGATVHVVYKIANPPKAR